MKTTEIKAKDMHKYIGRQFLLWGGDVARLRSVEESRIREIDLGFDAQGESYYGVDENGILWIPYNNNELVTLICEPTESDKFIDIHRAYNQVYRNKRMNWNVINGTTTALRTELIAN